MLSRWTAPTGGWDAQEAVRSVIFFYWNLDVHNDFKSVVNRFFWNLDVYRFPVISRIFFGSADVWILACSRISSDLHTWSIVG